MTRRGIPLLLLRGRRLLLRRSGGGSGGSAGGGARSARGRRRTRRGARCRALGGNAGFRGGGRSGGGGGGFGRRLHLFRVARRRHDGDEGVIELTHAAHVRRQRDLAQVLGVIDLEARDIDVDRFRDVLGRANHLDRVGDGVDGAA